MKKIFAILLVSFSASAATLTDFYADFALGNNLNAGSTTNAAALQTYTSAIVAAGWDQATGIFTVLSGNPSSDGVAVGDWASVYVTVGATVATFIGQVTARDTTTITVSLTAKSGTAPATDALGGTTIKVGGAWKGPNAAVNFPFNFVQATMTNLNSGIVQGLPPRVNGKAGATNFIIAAISHANAGPIVWQGYTTAAGDGGKWTICNTNLVGTGILSLTCVNNDFRDMVVHNNGATSMSVSGIVSTGAENNFDRVIVHDIRQSGFNISGVACNLYECEAYLCNKANTASHGGFLLSGAGITPNRCISHDNAGSNAAGFVVANNMVLIDCIADSNGGNGAIVSSFTALVLDGFVAYNNAANGVDLTSGSATAFYAENSTFVKNTTWGIASSGSPIRNGVIRNCAFGAGTQANGSGQIASNTGGIEIVGSITLANDITSFTDAPNGDFRPNVASVKGTGRGTFTQTQASYAGTIAYPDIGAAQHLETAGAGGSHTFVQ